MNIFDMLKRLFFSNKTHAEDLDYESAQLFQPYMINRWFSFYGRPQANFVNETLNKFSYLFDDKNEMYKLYYYLIPQCHYKHIQYVKKKKEKETEESRDIAVIAKNYMLSRREVTLYLDMQSQLNN